jgi:hypothetical protein
VLFLLYVIFRAARWPLSGRVMAIPASSAQFFENRPWAPRAQMVSIPSSGSPQPIGALAESDTPAAGEGVPEPAGGLEIVLSGLPSRMQHRPGQFMLWEIEG